jgi:hypothetical protein
VHGSSYQRKLGVLKGGAPPTVDVSLNKRSSSSSVEIILYSHMNSVSVYITIFGCKFLFMISMFVDTLAFLDTNNFLCEYINKHKFRFLAM